MSVENAKTNNSECTEEKDFFQVAESESGMRLDVFLSSQYYEYTRSYIQNIIQQGYARINGKTILKTGSKLKSEDCIEFRIPEPEPLKIEAENIPLDIVYEDDDVILINKPKGMVVHPAPGHTNGTIVNALMYHCRGSLSGINGIMRPGIVHRIDMDTTGVIIACKNDFAHNSIAAQLKEHSITRKYYAVVYGNLREDGLVDAPIGRDPANRKRMAVNYQHGKNAVTHYRIVKQLNGYTFIECRLETGRTHQIRVHMSSIGHPLLGDTLYGPARNPYKLQGQTLHAYILGFVHPRTGEYMEFTAPLPDYFAELLLKLER